MEVVEEAQGRGQLVDSGPVFLEGCQTAVVHVWRSASGGGQERGLVMGEKRCILGVEVTSIAEAERRCFCRQGTHSAVVAAVAGRGILAFRPGWS